MKGRRLICPDRRRIEVEEFEVPAPSRDQVLIENELTAVSTGTEVYTWVHGCEPGGVARFPRPTGYCSTGVVLAVGEEVRGIKTGDRVAAQGGHASHEVARHLVYRLPEQVDAEDAAFLVMAAIAMHGIRRAELTLGESVVVLGLGMVGQLALSLAHLGGALPLVAIDLDVVRLAHARRRGADLSLLAGATEEVVAQVRAACPEDGAQVVIEATGKPAAYPLAVRLACTAGRVVGLGSPRGTVEMDFMRDVHLREVDIVGAIQPITPEQDHIYYRWSKDRDRRLLLELMAMGRLRASDLITHRARPEDCQAVYEMLAHRPQEALGVVFRWR